MMLLSFPTHPRASGTGPMKELDVHAIVPLVGGLRLNEKVPEGRHP